MEKGKALSSSPVAAALPLCLPAVPSCATSSPLLRARERDFNLPSLSPFPIGRAAFKFEARRKLRFKFHSAARPRKEAGIGAKR